MIVIGRRSLHDFMVKKCNCLEDGPTLVEGGARGFWLSLGSNPDPLAQI